MKKCCICEKEAYPEFEWGENNFCEEHLNSGLFVDATGQNKNYIVFATNL